MKLALTLIALIFFVSCSSIISDSSQPFTVDTGDVTGATCRLSNAKGNYIIGSTPGTVTVDNACSAMQVVCSKDGYQTNSVSISHSHKGSTAGNIILGGGVGYLVDRGTGAACKYQTSVFVGMNKS